MKNWILFIVTLLFLSCNNSVIEKPNNLIDEDQMVDILYDIAVLDAMRTQNFGAPVAYPTTTEMLKAKHKVDSVTFAKSAKYYAADYKKYRKMYEEVKVRLEEETTKLNGGQPVTPNPEQGIVK